MLRRLIREPLLHFLIIGALLFLVYSLMSKDASNDDPRRIVVDQVIMDRLVQGFISQWQRSPDDVEISALIDEHVREEVLYREAKALGLDQNDAVVRLRLAQKMEALAMMDADAASEPGEEALRDYLARHGDSFARPAQLSFAHVFLSPDDRGPGMADEARALLGELRAAGPVVTDGLGDALPLRSRYQMITQREVARLFGRGFAARLFDLPAGSWQGPVESGFGLHLVLVSEHTAASIPPFEDVALDVRTAYLESQNRARRSAVLEDIKRGYEIVLPWPDPAAGR